jgi:hypothetical protein
MPLCTQLDILSSHNWNAWPGVFSAFLQLNDIDNILTHETFCLGWIVMTGIPSRRRRKLSWARTAHLMSTQLWILSLTLHYSRPSSTDFEKSLWIELTWVRLDNGSPLSPQRAKLNEASVQLANGHL